jgi:hypothetical protein
VANPSQQTISEHKASQGRAFPRPEAGVFGSGGDDQARLQTDRVSTSFKTTVEWSLTQKGGKEMQTKRIATIVTVVAALTLLLAASSTVAGPPVEGGKGSGKIILAGTVASKISYQGRLTDAGGSPLNGNYNLVFQLWDDATAGSQIGNDIPKNNVTVSNGLFTVALEVPQDAFNGQALWLRVQVNGQWLSPRQELVPAPYALNLKPGAFIQGGQVEGHTTSSDEWVAAVYGENEGAGDGVHGRSHNRYGIYGVTLSQNLAHAAVYGNGGYTHGVYGETLAGSAHGVHGEAGAFSTGVGVYGESSMGNGIVGKTNAYNKNGVYGWSENGVGVSGRGDANDGVVGWTGASDKSGVYGHSDDGTGVTGRSGNNHGIFGATFSTDTDHAGVFARNNGAGSGVYGEALGSDGRGVYGIARGTDGVGVLGVGSTGVLAQANASGTALWAVVPDGYGTAIYAESGPAGGYAAELRGNVQIRSRTTGATVIELGEGLDYAEGFDVSDRTGISPGTVLVIDPEHPGKLAVSNRPYDRKVAGIVTGANGLGSAVRLGPGQFDYDVALAGRVYCNVDATYGEVAPGDLLTTSPTPGCAMVVSDHAKAVGAILGKAMEALPEGEKGQILVLVSLQ